MLLDGVERLRPDTADMPKQGHGRPKLLVVELENTLSVPLAEQPHIGAETSASADRYMARVQQSQARAAMIQHMSSTTVCVDMCIDICIDVLYGRAV